MLELLHFIKLHRRDYCKQILESITEYKYRDQRYETYFSLMVIHIEKAVYTKEVFDSALRLTDHHIELTPNIHCIVLDSVSNKSYIKAAENIQYTLQKREKNTFYVSAVESENYKNDYFKMIKDLFDFLEYAVEHNFTNIVVDSDSNI